MTTVPGDTMQPILETRGLTKVFGNGTQALTEVDLTVRPGTIHGIVGANGAGKSTLIKIISGAIRPSAGSVTWQGRGVDCSSPYHFAMTVLPDDLAALVRLATFVQRFGVPRMDTATSSSWHHSR